MLEIRNNSEENSSSRVSLDCYLCGLSSIYFANTSHSRWSTNLHPPYAGTLFSKPRPLSSLRSFLSSNSQPPSPSYRTLVVTLLSANYSKLPVSLLPITSPLRENQSFQPSFESFASLVSFRFVRLAQSHRTLTLYFLMLYHPLFVVVVSQSPVTFRGRDSRGLELSIL